MRGVSSRGISNASLEAQAPSFLPDARINDNAEFPVREDGWRNASSEAFDMLRLRKQMQIKL